MLTLKYITENTAEVIERLAKKYFDGKEVIENVVALDANRKATQVKLDNTLAEINQLSKQVGDLFKQGKAEEANQIKAQTANLKEQSKELSVQLDSIEKEITELLLTIPNLPNNDVPEGRTAEDNVIVRTGGNLEDLPKEALPHWELAKKYDLIDFELGVKISGAGFPVYKGKARNCNVHLSTSSWTKHVLQVIPKLCLLL